MPKSGPTPQYTLPNLREKHFDVGDWYIVGWHFTYAKAHHTFQNLRRRENLPNGYYDFKIRANPMCNLSAAKLQDRCRFHIYVKLLHAADAVEFRPSNTEPSSPSRYV